MKEMLLKLNQTNTTKEFIIKFLFSILLILPIFFYIYLFPSMNHSDLVGMFALYLPLVLGHLGIFLVYKYVKNKKSFLPKLISVAFSLIVFVFFFFLGSIISLIIILLREP